MGAITLEKANHLFWLGRYAERMTGTIRMYMKVYDIMIDKDENAFVGFCQRLSIPSDIYSSAEEFIDGFVYDNENIDSMVCCIHHAYDNAVMLREEITGETLAYIELAKNLLERDEENRGTMMLELQNVLDYINAFWGSANDTVDEACRSIMKCGKHAEKLDIQYRFEIEDESCKRELAKLKHRIQSLNANFQIRGLKGVEKLFYDTKTTSKDYIEKITALTNCFEDWIEE